MQSLEQLRAKNAFTFIEENQTNSDITGIATRLPLMFHLNGVLATFAFLIKNEKVNKLTKALLDHLRESARANIPEAFRAEHIFQGERAWVKPENLQTSDFFTITDEMIKYATWLKRAAEALATD